MAGTVLVDVGNTNTCLALARGKRIGRERRLPSRARSAAAMEAAVRETAGGTMPDGAVLCSVVPGAVAGWSAALRRLTGVDPVVVTHRLRLGVDIDYPRPASIGADRLANASGALARYGAPAIVADFGTALTFDIISRERAYIGGVIAPGLLMMTDYLAERTALLPAILLPGRYGPVGKSTAGAMRLGAKVGYRGMVREIVLYLRASLDIGDAVLCATGGLARWALKGLDLPFVFDPRLTMRGLYRIYELNAKGNTQ